jgi:hypothetical protein
MESAGFYASALRHATVEFVHVLKVVSDNNAADLRVLDRSRITALIAAHIDIVQALANALLSLGVQTYPDIAAMAVDEFFLRWHFSHAQRTRLRALAQRWAVLKPATPWPPTSIDECRDAGAVLMTLDVALEAAELPLRPRVRS